MKPTPSRRASIVIQRGPGARAAAAPADLVWDTALPVPFAGLRAGFALARQRVGDVEFSRAIAPQRAQLSLLLRGLAVDDDERQRRQRDGALYRAFLPTAVAPMGPFIRPLVDIMAALIGPVRLVVRELGRCDLGSLQILRRIARSAGGALEVMIGHDTDIAPAGGIAGQLRQLQLRELALLEALPGSRVEPGAPTPAPPLAALDCADDGREAWALAADSLPLDEGLTTLRQAFDAYGFQAALALADRLLTEVDASPAQRRELHGLAALACHNLQPLPRPADPLAQAAYAHFAAALADEPDPLMRAQLHHRLALLSARGLADLATARAHAESAVTLAAPRPLFAAWAHNGRAYVQLRAGELDGAAADCEAGLARIDEPDDAPAVERARTALLLANNRARVAHAAGDRAAQDRWRAVVAVRVLALPPDERPGARWLQSPPAALDQLAAAHAYHSEALAQASAALDPEEEAVSAHELALVAYRLGDTEAARAGFERARAIWRITGGFAEDLLTEELNVAVTAFRARDWDAAERGFQSLRAQPPFADPAPQAEALAALAMIAAGRGTRELAYERAASAVALAGEAGDAGAQLRVLRSLAEVHLMAGERAAARDVLERALRLADDDGAAAAEDVLGVVAALLAAGAPEAPLVERALTLLPAALADANAWWDLPRLAAALAERRADPTAAALLALAEQRADCRRPVRVASA